MRTQSMHASMTGYESTLRISSSLLGGTQAGKSTEDASPAREFQADLAVAWDIRGNQLGGGRPFPHEEG